MLVSSPTTGMVETDLEIAAPSGGVAAESPTTIRYAGTTFDIALMPVCFAAYIPDPFSNPCFFRVGTNFSSNEVGGLPFATSHLGMVSSFINAGQVVTSTSNTISATVGNGVTNIRLHNNQNTGDSHNPNTTAEYYRLNFTYRAA